MSKEEREALEKEKSDLEYEKFLINMADYLSSRDWERIRQIDLRVFQIRDELAKGVD